jgi:hypothetical protein
MNKRKAQKLVFSKMNKKAELTTQQIVMIIILLASFVVLLVFIVKVNFQDTSEKGICQSSVQLAAKTKVGFFSGKIDCKINYLCISGGGECQGFTYKDTAKINLNDKENAKKEVMKILADEMADCWWMFGEGKIDYIGWEWTENVGCAVCTQFAFDENIKKSGITISPKEFCDYLKTPKIVNKPQTYAEYLGIDTSYPCPSIDFKEKYSIYTGRVEPGIITSWIPGGIVKDSSILPIILKRDDSTTIKCSSFVTTP